ncbi:methylisocitrate lyase [Serratia marcescens]|uniref:isocitrate lyase/phosphoenolpyruvate mutase family protein n=1 Tax=Serratia marcescens TaxID=615 RepID=UPI00141A618F|nr:isocitrate lyase/phosphoenolpyruvate mutase family protein [Serratia marcescens]NIA32705.1 methylisocitrate lyase [Serratia marcescens]
MTLRSPGLAFRQALSKEKPLQIAGAINANHALLAQRAGFQAIYLSGGGVAAGSLGLPDLGISTLDDVLTDIRRITDVCPLPLLVDVDSGFGASAFNVARTVRSVSKAGADMLFPEAITELGMYRRFAEATQVPILANITEFGATPLFTTDELRSARVDMALYPLSAFRAMNRAAERVYRALREEGTQKSVIDTMQTRNELYESINYYLFEEKLDALFARQRDE